MVQEGNEALNFSLVIAAKGALSNREANGTLNLRGFPPLHLAILLVSSPSRLQASAFNSWHVVRGY